MKQQELRNSVKRIKWEENISYKEIAEDLLDIDYNSFINWLHEYYNLGAEKEKLLKDYVNCFIV